MCYNIDSVFWKTKRIQKSSQKNFLSIHAENPAKVYNEITSDTWFFKVEDIILSFFRIQSMCYDIDSAFWKTKESKKTSENFLSIHAENPAKVYNEIKSDTWFLRV